MMIEPSELFSERRLGEGKDRLKHRLGELARERILLAWMIGADQPLPVGQINGNSMAKFWPWLGQDTAVFLVRRKKGVEGDFTEDDDDSRASEQSQLFDQIQPAALEFNETGLVVGRRAAHRRSNVTIGEFQAIVAMIGIRLIGKALGMERAVEPIAAAIAGKDPSRAIAAVRRRRQSDDQYARARIAESRQRPGPILHA